MGKGQVIYTLVKVIGILIILSIIATLCWFTALILMMQLDKRQIKKDTIHAFKTAQFDLSAIDKLEEIKVLSNFMIRNLDEIKSFNRHDNYRSVRITDNSSFAGYTNNGPCFSLYSFHDGFLEEYIPHELIDSLQLFTGGLSNGMIKSMIVCEVGYPKSININHPSFSIQLYHNESTDYNFYETHSIIFNQQYTLNRKLESIYDEALSKDTALIDDFHYVIKVRPYAGL